MYHFPNYGKMMFSVRKCSLLDYLCMNLPDSRQFYDCATGNQSIMAETPAGPGQSRFLVNRPPALENLFLGDWEALPKKNFLTRQKKVNILKFRASVAIYLGFTLNQKCCSRWQNIGWKRKKVYKNDAVRDGDGDEKGCEEGEFKIRDKHE